MIGLVPEVDIIFEPDAGHFLLLIPYGNAARDFLSCYGMAGIKREWMAGFKMWMFAAKDYDNIMELLPDFFAEDVKC